MPTVPVAVSWEQVAQWANHPVFSHARNTATVTDGPDGRLWSELGAQIAAGLLADSGGTVSFDTLAGAVVGLSAAAEVANDQGQTPIADQNAAAAHALVVFADAVIAETLLDQPDTVEGSSRRL